MLPSKMSPLLPEVGETLLFTFFGLLRMETLHYTVSLTSRLCSLRINPANRLDITYRNTGNNVSLFSLETRCWQLLKSETDNVKLSFAFVKSDESAQSGDNHLRTVFSPFKFDWHPASESVQGNAYGHSNSNC